jgi:hypothetical protein
MKKYDHTWLIAEWERMGRPEVVRYSTAREGWEKDEDPKFIVHFQYRIKSKPWINWEHVSAFVVAMATNSSGVTLFYDCAPKKSIVNGNWFVISFPSGSAEMHSSFIEGTCDWRDSLVMRPVVIGDK